MSDELNIRRFDASNVDVFFELHKELKCYCAAWWVPTWEEWDSLDESERLAVRMRLLENGEYDGYLLFDGDDAIGWCQVGPRDRLSKLVQRFDLEPDPAVWAITCMLLVPERRRQGNARAFVEMILADLSRRGIARVQAFPKVDADLPDDDVWTGPRGLYERTGFVGAGGDERTLVVERDLR